MLAMWVKVRVKPDQRDRFLKAIEVDALGSEGDEPGCMCFNVLQDEQDQNVYYFYEVYRDQVALEAHRAAPHYAVWRAAADTLDGPAEATRCQTVFPAAAHPAAGAVAELVLRLSQQSPVGQQVEQSRGDRLGAEKDAGVDRRRQPAQRIVRPGRVLVVGARRAQPRPHRQQPHLGACQV